MPVDAPAAPASNAPPAYAASLPSGPASPPPSAVLTPPGDDDADQFFDSSESIPLPAPAGSAGEDRYARVTAHLKAEPTLSPNVLTPLLNMLGWGLVCDALNRAVLADGIAHVRAAMYGCGCTSSLFLT